LPPLSVRGMKYPRTQDAHDGRNVINAESFVT
jgi:hypothetical protein